jgi:serine/threonine protein kinase/Tol biopolymer transport system component
MSLDKGYLLYGRYRVESILGRGGMGAVYRAIDENLGMAVAVKENLFTTEEYARQFRREANILAALRHPNLPRVTDHFVIPGQGQYLVMDYIDGEDLRTRMDKGNLPNERITVEWARQICEALHYLHTRQPPVVHRDIKPGNIRITLDGRAVLVDFGLARLMEGPTTTTGAKAMTPGYSPPEQYGASRTDARTDIYALAATMYSLLAGTMPEDGLERALGQKSLTPVRTRNPKISAGVAAAIEKALEVLPENRFQSIDELFKALTAALPGIAVPTTAGASSTLKAPEKAVPAAVKKSPPPPMKKPPTPSARHFPWGCAALFSFLIFIAALLVTFFLFQKQILAILKPESNQTPALSADDQTQTALAAAIGTTPTIGAIETATPESNTPIPTHTATPSLKPVGGSLMIAYVSNKTGIPQIYTMDINGENVHQFTTDEDFPDGACQPDWSPDGSQLIFTSPCKSTEGLDKGTAIFKMNADGSGMTSLTKVPGGDFDPAWSPDGKRIAVISLQDGQDQNHIYLMDSNGNNRVLFTKSKDVDAQPRWSPDGSMIVFVSFSATRSVIFYMDIDPNITYRQEFSFDPAYSWISPDWSMNNDILYINADRNQIVVKRWDPQNLTKKPSTIGDAYKGTTIARFSPDGQWILFDMVVKNNRDIYMLPIVGGKTPKQLTTDRAVESDPAWRPIPDSA